MGLNVHPNSLIGAPLTAKVHSINWRHVGTTQLHISKLALILKIYQECDRREGDNKGSRCSCTFIMWLKAIEGGESTLLKSNKI